jgi:hypothetical protein
MKWQVPLPAARAILDDKRVEDPHSTPFFPYGSVAELRT